MPTLTPNYGLKKTQYNEQADIEILNENFDIIDSKLKEVADSIPTSIKAQDVLTNDGTSLETFYQNSKNKLGKDLEARNEIIDIKLKLKEQTAINFINKTGIGFFDTFMDNTYIDIVNTTATYNSTNKNVEFGNLTPYSVTAYEATTTDILKIKYPHSAKKGDLVKGTNEILNLENEGSSFDVQDTTVVSGNYNTQGNGGRKLVRLDNGTLVCGAYSSANNRIDLYKSIDNGLTWSILDTNGVVVVGSLGGFSLISNGKYIYLFFTQVNGGNAIRVYNSSGGVVSSIALDTNQTAMGECSLAINEAKTELHACWSSKNNTYPNSFNIRYAKGTINSDGTVTWGSVEQKSASNTSGQDNKNPTIVSMAISPIPLIVCQYEYNSNTSYAINYNNTSGQSWNSIFNGVTYSQYVPSAIYVPPSISGTPNGRIWVTWHGLNVGNTTYQLKVSYSDSLGNAWSTPQDLTNVTGQNLQTYPSITANKNNEIFIVWVSQAGTVFYTQLRKIKWSNGTWGSIENIKTVTGNFNLNYPSTLVDFSINFSSPLVIFKDDIKPSINFYGTWDAIIDTKLTLKNPINATLNEVLNVVPQTQKLKMKNEIFDTFNSMDLNLYMNKMYKATVKTNASNTKTLELSQTDKTLYNGSKLWINNKSNEIENILPQLTTIDRQDTTVISGSYSTQGNVGRKLVRLDNGTLVCGVINGTTEVRFYKSSDNSLTWSFLGYMNLNTTDFSISTDGKNVFILITSNASSIVLFYAKTLNWDNLSNTTIDNQTALGNCSLAINEAKTELHACWSSTNNTYPNSFNIRYAKGTINADGTVTWGSVEYVDKYNTSGTNMMNPSVIVTSYNVPIVFFEFASSSANQFAIGCRYRNPSNSNWEVRSVMASTNRNQISPSAIYVPSSISGTPNGRIWVTWAGTDSTDNVYNIRVSYSDDLGVTWSSVQKLTTGNTYGQVYPSITANKNNEIFILWHGYITGSWNSIRKIKWSNGTWVAIENVTNQTNSPHHYHPSTLVDFSINFTSPLFIYTQHQTKIGFYGTWEDFGGYTLTMKDPVTLNTNDKVTIVDMEVLQDGQPLPLINADNEKFMYKTTTLDTNTSKITVKGYENKLESIVYAIA